MNPAEVFRRIVLHLERRGIPYMLVGSFAGTYFGLSRSTYDLDIVVEAVPDQLEGLIADLQADNYYAELDDGLKALRQESLFNIIDNTTGWKIDLIFRKARSFEIEEFRRRVPAKLFDIQLYVASAEDVVISKLEWAKLGGSQRQIEDVGKVLAAQWKTLDHSYLSKWIKELQLEQQWSAAKGSAEFAE